MDLLRYLMNFAEHWLGAMSHIMLAFFGLMICVLVAGALWDRRLRVSGAILGVSIGLAVVFSPFLFRIFSSFQDGQRVRLGITILAIIILVFTTQAINKKVLLKRYALIWIVTSLVLLGTVVYPSFFKYAKAFFDFDQLEYLASGGCLFLLILSFHFTIALTKLQSRYEKLTKRCAALEQLAGNQQLGLETSCEVKSVSAFQLANESITSTTKKSSIFSEVTVGRTIRGTLLGAPLVIVITVLSVLAIGLLSPQPMVGDEVTHYYMLTTQSHNLLEPDFLAEIPIATGEGDVEVRRYPHSFLWHYFGALIYRVSGDSFVAIQVYQTFFLLQLLVVAYLLALSRGGGESRSALLYILTISSLPLCLMFSVVFYQDVPMTAQALTAFLLLNKRRWLLASLFMAIAIGFKETALLFLPAFFLVFLYWRISDNGWKKGLISFLISFVIISIVTCALAVAVNKYSGSVFYPQRQLDNLIGTIKNSTSFLWHGEETKKQLGKSIISSSFADATPGIPDKAYKKRQRPAIANHPGDLRIKENFLTYGGLLLWVVLILSIFALIFRREHSAISSTTYDSGGLWLWGVGGSYLLVSFVLIRSAPDARFFLPGLMFILLPVVERVVMLPKTKLLISLLATLAFLQGGYVLAKTYDLRVVSPEIKEAILFLKEQPLAQRKIFMYPEGNYRLFPYPHEWYFKRRLKEFWRGSNEKRIQMLQEYHVGGIVIKKYLIGRVDKDITNLGVYPVKFVRDIAGDERFKKVFDNRRVVIYLPPLNENHPVSE